MEELGDSRKLLWRRLEGVVSICEQLRLAGTPVSWEAATGNGMRLCDLRSSVGPLPLSVFFAEKSARVGNVASKRDGLGDSVICVRGDGLPSGSGFVRVGDVGSVALEGWPEFDGYTVFTALGVNSVLD